MAMEWKSLQVGVIDTNCYLVKDTVTGKGAIIDPGDSAILIDSVIQQMKMQPEVIFLTHGHFDHFMAAESLRKTHQIPVYIHKGDAQMAQPAGMPKPNATHFYDEGDVIRVGELEFHVLHTPGHSEGSVTLKCGTTLFTGDTLFKGSMGRTDFPGGSDAKIFASLIRLAELPGNYDVCPGHEGVSTLEEERATNYCIRYAFNHR